MFSAEPWKVNPNNPLLVKTGYRGLLVINAGTKDNARLIAQAPTAHQLLVEMVHHWSHPQDPIDITDWLKSAAAYFKAVEGSNGTR